MKNALRYLLMLSLAVPCGTRGADKAAPTRLRRPLVLALVNGGDKLLVGNRDTGTVQTIDTKTFRVLGETRAARKLSDMALRADNRTLVITDEATGDLILLEAHNGERPGVSRPVTAYADLRRIHVGTSPVSVRIDDKTNLATVACLWPRRLAIVDLAQGKIRGVVDLPFAPRCQVIVPGQQRVVVADSFGGNLAVVDIAAMRLLSVRTLNMHNIRGLVLDKQAKNLLIAHQTINAQGHTTSGEIRTSNVITNNVRKLALAEVLDPLADLTRDERFYQLGGVERGAGDPSQLCETDRGEIVVALAGVDELAIGRPENATWTHLPLGRRPAAVVVDEASRRAYVANMFDDSIAVIDLKKPAVLREIPLGSPVKDLLPHERGEVLFFDARRSFEAWYSCHSCHSDGHTSGRLNDNFSDGSFGTPKRILSLLGAKDTGPWAWNGKMIDLESQVRTSITSTMQGSKTSSQDIADIAAYLRTFEPPPSVQQARGTSDADAQKRGRKVFVREKCASCHTPPTYTSAKTYDVGLADEAGEKHFNPPSLRGISQGGPYFHDNRAKTLEEVFTRFRHQLSAPLSQEEVHDLVYFLENL